MSEEEIQNVSMEAPTDDIFEELEQEEMEELNKIAEEALKEAQKRKEELEKFAKEVTIADIIECMEKIKKFMDVYREAMRTNEVLRELVAEREDDPSKAFIRMFMGGRF